jgi:D-glutamate cyclase
VLIHNQYSQQTLDKIARIEIMCGQDVGRGIQPLVHAAKGGLLAAARAIAEHPLPHVAIITGFFLPQANPPAAETDGPIGCAQLAAALTRIGIPVRIVTDSLCFHAVKIAAIAAGVSSSIIFDTIAVNGEEENKQAVASLLAVWESLVIPVSHVISIERAGPSYSGIVCNMKGEDITSHTAPLHLLFSSQKIISIGIGDGGNELGMGNIPKDLIAQNILHGDKIACTIRCNHLIVCGVSNWGATGLLAALAILRSDWEAQIFEGLQPETEFDILENLVNNGPAVDGIRRVKSLSVDNLSWDLYVQVLNMVLQLIIRN